MKNRERKVRQFHDYHSREELGQRAYRKPAIVGDVISELGMPIRRPAAVGYAIQRYNHPGHCWWQTGRIWSEAKDRTGNEDAGVRNSSLRRVAAASERRYCSHVAPVAP